MENKHQLSVSLGCPEAALHPDRAASWHSLMGHGDGYGLQLLCFHPINIYKLGAWTCMYHHLPEIFDVNIFGCDPQQNILFSVKTSNAGRSVMSISDISGQTFKRAPRVTASRQCDFPTGYHPEKDPSLENCHQEMAGFSMFWLIGWSTVTETKLGFMDHLNWISLKIGYPKTYQNTVVRTCFPYASCGGMRVKRALLWCRLSPRTRWSESWRVGDRPPILSFIHSCMHACIHSFIHSSIHSFLVSFLHLFIDVYFIHVVIDWLIHAFIPFFTHSLIHLFRYSLTHLSVHAFMQSFSPSFYH